MKKLKTKQKNIFFSDRDGIINLDLGYVHKKEDFHFYDNIFNTFQYIQNLGYEIIIITNQSGIARKFYSEEDFIMLNDWMISIFKSNGINILDTFYCPHLDNDKCNCRKPKDGMFLSAFKKYDVNKKNSWMIGDKLSDMEAAVAAGIKNTILFRCEDELDISKYKIKNLEELYSIVKC